MNRKIKIAVMIAMLMVSVTLTACEDEDWYEAMCANPKEPGDHILCFFMKLQGAGHKPQAELVCPPHSALISSKPGLSFKERCACETGYAYDSGFTSCVKAATVPLNA